MKKKLTIDNLKAEAKAFCIAESKIQNKSLFGITDGKAVGTHIEHKFQEQLTSKYKIAVGSSASGIDLPSEDILTDIKVTSIKQPQSSCPFKDAKQKIFGLGYNLLVFVYDKTDNPRTKTAKLDFVSCSFISKERTADYTTTYRLREMVKDKANVEDIVAYLSDKNIPADEITLNQLAKQILKTPPNQGYLTISNALQWRLQYQRVVTLDKKIQGISKIIDKATK
ncbi:MAG TPA: restriction endonuclease [Bacteroidales bacterium]|nr:restriction endonuclease [Bacteroidales bacterium]HOR82669.1 restriction endonuclease [Bacteroidales bacterium]HPJ92038.1 restriction endonuclease [Bacteroidales bacterium]